MGLRLHVTVTWSLSRSRQCADGTLGGQVDRLGTIDHGGLSLGVLGVEQCTAVHFHPGRWAVREDLGKADGDCQCLTSSCRSSCHIQLYMAERAGDWELGQLPDLNAAGSRGWQVIERHGGLLVMQNQSATQMSPASTEVKQAAWHAQVLKAVSLDSQMTSCQMNMDSAKV